MNSEILKAFKIRNAILDNKEKIHDYEKLSNEEKEVLDDLLEKIRNESDDEEFKIKQDNVKIVFLISDYKSRQAIIDEKIEEHKFKKKYALFYSEDDFYNKSMNRKSSKSRIDFDELNLDDNNNFLRYKETIINDSLKISDSIIVNISGKSLNRLWKKYDRRLLNLNLRFFIKNKTIDEQIEKTINDNSNQFWYLNNGLVILCRDYKIEGNILILKKFSIVNGGQTTNLIGKMDQDKIKDDLFLPAKIIKVNSDDEEKEYDFINKIAEATNRQKPIKDKDLIVNNKFLKQFKNNIYENPEFKFFVIARTGEFKNINREDQTRINKSKKKIEAEKIIKCFNAFNNLKPGSSRSLESSEKKEIL